MPYCAKYQGFILCLSLSLFTGFAMSCTGRRMAASLDDIETVLVVRPDSALAAVQTIDTAALTTVSLRAHYALLYAMALDKNWVDTTDVDVVMPAVTYYDRHGPDERKMKAWYYLGRIQENAGDLTAACVSFLKADRYSVNTKDIRFRALTELSLSNIYNKSHLHTEALVHTEEAYALFLQAGDTLSANAALYRMAQDLNNVGRYAESDSLFNVLILNDSVHPNLRSSLLGSYALNLINRNGDYIQAVNLFEKAIALSGNLESDNEWGAYAYALSRIGNTTASDTVFLRLNQGLSYYAWKSSAAAYFNSYEDAYHLLKKASSIQTDNVHKIIEMPVMKAQEGYWKQIAMQAESQKKRRAKAAFLTLSLLVTGCIVFFICYKRRLLRERESLLDICRDLRVRHAELASDCSDLNAAISKTEAEKAQVRKKYIQLAQSYFSNIGRIQEMLFYHTDYTDGYLFEELKRGIRKIGLDVERQQLFEQMLNDSFYGVMTHFREAFPNKKPEYYRFVSYLFAGFSTATICAIIPKYNKHNVHVEKSRIKKTIISSESPFKEQFLELLL